MIRVLQVFGEPLANGGQESFIMNMYRNIDHSKVQFDFFSPFGCQNEDLRKEITSNGGCVFTDDYVFGENNNLYFKKGLCKFLTNNNYSIVHIHSGSTYALMMGAKIAKQCHSKTVIVHSHCGGFSNLKYKIIKILSVPYLMKYPNYYFACSKLAAEWKFPKKIIEKKQYSVIKNAIDIKSFFYCENLRQEYRKKFNVSDKLVVGHIGRFAIQKNHKYLIEIFNEMVKQDENCILMLVGAGELEKEIRAQVKILGIDSKVLFLGIRKDINELLNCFDLLLLPSFFEGLPVVAVEAQATGLPVFASTNITQELPLEKLSNYISLDIEPKLWAKNILQEINKFNRINTTESIIQHGYEIKNAAKKLENFYINIGE